MNYERLTGLALLFLALAVSWPAGAWALQEQRGQAAQDSVDVSGLGPAEPAAGMDRESGRQGVQIDQLNLTLSSNESNGYLGNNHLESAATGSNSISDNAFANASGIATVIQNTGNQVLIQNSLILNLTTQ